MRKKSINQFIIFVLSIGFSFSFVSIFGQNFTKLTSGATGLPDVADGELVWADFDNDGDLDLLISGAGSSGKISAVYRNNSDDTFTNWGAGFIPLAQSSVAVSDFDNDGFVDVLMIGSGDDMSDESITAVYKNKGGGIFETLPVSLPGVTNGAARIADIDNDGWNDIILTGRSGTGTDLYIYRNNGNETFSSYGHNIDPVYEGDLQLSDFNSDGYIDIVISGFNNNNQRITALYFNLQDGTFSKYSSAFPPLRTGGLVAADINNNGYTDLFLTGSFSSDSAVAVIYQNNGGTSYSLSHSLPSLQSGTGAFGDYNNDGYTDLLYFGEDIETTDRHTLLYSNANGNNFIASGEAIPAAKAGDIKWADYNNDGKLDFVLSGYSIAEAPFTNLFKNQVPSPNSPPTTPDGLTATVKGDQVMLNWNPATDDESGTGGLTYQIYVGATSGTADIVSPMSDLITGYRKIAAPGILCDTFAIVEKLSEGKYYWSVQAIDQSFSASAFAVEEEFGVCDSFSIGNDTTICHGERLNLHVGSGDDIVTWYSASASDPIASGNDLSYTVTQRDTIYVALSKTEFGCVAYDSMIVDVIPLPDIHLEADTLICLNDTLSIEFSAVDSVNWYTADGDLIVRNSFRLDHSVAQSETIVVEAFNAAGCVNFDSMDIEVIELPAPDLGSDIAVCMGNEVELHSNLFSDSVNWYSSLKGELALGQVAFHHTVSEQDTLWVKAYNSHGCVGTDTIIAQPLTLPMADAGEDQIACAGFPVTLGGNYSEEPSDLEFFWNPGGTLSDVDVANPVATPIEDMEYVLKVTDRYGCENTDTVKLSLDEPTVVDPGCDTTICKDSGIRLGANPTAQGSLLAYSYKWSPVNSLDDPTSPNPIATPAGDETYQLIVSTTHCPVDTSQVHIQVVPLPEVTTTPDMAIGFGESIQLQASGGVSYRWQPETGLNNVNISDPVASPETTTTYTVNVTDEHGCLAQDSVVVKVSSQVFIPELFTPNADGNNDTFRVYGTGILEIIFEIYNRRGQLLYRSNDPEEVMGQGWDGTYEGKPLPADTYIWGIRGRFSDGQPISFKGSNSGPIKLLR